MTNFANNRISVMNRLKLSPDEVLFFLQATDWARTYCNQAHRRDTESLELDNRDLRRKVRFAASVLENLAQSQDAYVKNVAEAAIEKMKAMRD